MNRRTRTLSIYLCTVILGLNLILFSSLCIADELNDRRLKNNQAENGIQQIVHDDLEGIKVVIPTTISMDKLEIDSTDNTHIEYQDGSRYEGEIKKGLRSGYGILFFFDGSSYAGNWKADKISGEGKYTFQDGSYLEGTFRNNSFREGIYYTENENGIFQYIIKKGKWNNRLKVSLFNGDTYAGKLKNGIFSGSCNIKYNDGDYYSGQLKNNLKDGNGTYTWNNGAYYTGKWANDMMNGHGSYCFEKDGYPKLTGAFYNNKPDGILLYYIDSNLSLETIWENGVCYSVVD